MHFERESTWQRPDYFHSIVYLWQAHEKLRSLVLADRLNLGLEAFTALVLLRKEEAKDAEMDALQASMAALKMKQAQEERERERARQHESLEHCAASSLNPALDTRVRLVIDTNIYLEVSRDVERVWDDFERLHYKTAKVDLI